MRILITGARGNFPAVLIPLLKASDHDLVLFDLEPIQSETSTVIQGDIRDAGAVTLAMQGCSAVIHAAALHGDAASRRNYDDFYNVNVTGTHNVLLAMHRCGVKQMVFSSSEAVYGAGMKGHRVMNESVPRIPNGIYPLTKMLGEEMCEFYARQHGFHIAMLRYGCFVPADWMVAGLGRLGNWLTREDVAQANLLALGAVMNEEFACEAFLIQCAKPFTEADWPQLATDPNPVLEKYWPGSVDLLAENGLAPPKIHVHYDITKAHTRLGYEPEHNFEEFLAKLKRQ
jgi:UDP-glucose 4-epimerase